MERADLRARLRAVVRAEERGDLLFLEDPGAPPADRAAAEWVKSAEMTRGSGTGEGWLGVRTGGSGGVIKYARHDEATIGAAVAGFCAAFELERVNAVGVLPLHHVSGLLAWARCEFTGGTYVGWDWKQLEKGAWPPIPAGNGSWFISLVPTQLQRLLRVPGSVAWLREFRLIFVGGGPLWPELGDAAAAAELPLSLAYGMTETAAMVAAQRPGEFLAGARDCGTPLPHASITVTGEGTVRVGGASLFHGYYPDWSDAREFTTGDLGSLDGRGRLQILGRRDAMIITGGKKVHPAEVEAVLRASGEFSEVAVIGVPDADWGEAVIACYPGQPGRSPDLARAVEGLAAHQRPKRFVALAAWPQTELGKVNRAALRAAVVARD